MMDPRTVARIATRIAKRLIAPLAQRVRLTVSRGVVRLVDDAKKCQQVQVALLTDELRDDVERWQEYGFTSVPIVGDGNAEALWLSIGGNRSHGAVACVMDRTLRPRELTPGDVCFFTDKGERVYLNTTEDVVHIGAKAAAEFIAQATKTLTELQAVVTKYNPHTQNCTGTIGPSAVPGVAAPPMAHQMAAPGSVAATKAKVT